MHRSLIKITRIFLLVLLISLFISCSLFKIKSKELPLVIFNEKDGSEMLLIPEGEFIMGNDGLENTQPKHKVHLTNYYIDKYEITVKQYREFLQNTDVKDRTPMMPL